MDPLRSSREGARYRYLCLPWKRLLRRSSSGPLVRPSSWSKRTCLKTLLSMRGGFEVVCWLSPAGLMFVRLIVR